MRPPAWVFALAATPQQRLLLCALWSFANPANTSDGHMVVWPATKRLAEMLGRRATHVRADLRALYALGVVERIGETDVGCAGFLLASDAPVADEMRPDGERLEEDGKRPHGGRNASGRNASAEQTECVRDGDGMRPPDRRNASAPLRTRTERELEREENDKSRLQPVRPRPGEGPSAGGASQTALLDLGPPPDDPAPRHARIAEARHEARVTAYADAPTTPRRTPLTPTERRIVGRLLAAGYTVDDICRALRRKGEQARREPKYRVGGKVRCNRGLVSLAHLGRAKRGTSGKSAEYANLDRLLMDKSLDERVDVAQDGSFVTDATAGQVSEYATFTGTLRPPESFAQSVDRRGERG